MPRYAVCFSKTNGSSVRELTEIITGGALQRQRIDFLSVGCVTTPADAFFKYVVRRVTGLATASVLTKYPTDPNDSATAGCAAYYNITVDHASFASGPEVFRTPCHHRAVCIFAAADGQELVGPAVVDTGISLGLVDVSTNAFDGTVIYKE